MTASLIKFTDINGTKKVMSINTQNLIENDLTKILVHELEHASLANNEDIKASNARYLEAAYRPFFEDTDYSRKQKIAVLGGAVLMAFGLVSAGTTFDNETIRTAGFFVLPATIAGVAIDGIRRMKSFNKKLKSIRHEIYLQKPEEILARDAADNFENNLFAINQKEVTYPEEQLKDAMMKSLAYVHNLPQLLNENE